MPSCLNHSRYLYCRSTCDTSSNRYSSTSSCCSPTMFPISSQEVVTKAMLRYSWRLKNSSGIVPMRSRSVRCWRYMTSSSRVQEPELLGRSVRHDAQLEMCRWHAFQRFAHSETRGEHCKSDFRHQAHANLVCRAEQQSARRHRKVMSLRRHHKR